MSWSNLLCVITTFARWCPFGATQWNSSHLYFICQNSFNFSLLFQARFELLCLFATTVRHKHCVNHIMNHITAIIVIDMTQLHAIRTVICKLFHIVLVTWVSSGLGWTVSFDLMHQSCVPCGLSKFYTALLYLRLLFMTVLGWPSLILLNAAKCLEKRTLFSCEDLDFYFSNSVVQFLHSYCRSLCLDGRLIKKTVNVYRIQGKHFSQKHQQHYHNWQSSYNMEVYFCCYHSLLLNLPDLTLVS